jgi:hypothetical protein
METVMPQPEPDQTCLSAPSETLVRKHLTLLPPSCWAHRDIFWDDINEWWELPTYARGTGWGLVSFDMGELWYCYDRRKPAPTITTCPAWEPLMDDVPVGWLVWLSRHDTFTITRGFETTTFHAKDIKTKLTPNNVDPYTLVSFLNDRITDLEDAVGWLGEKVNELDCAPGMPGFVKAERRFYARAALCRAAL